ncbi:MAG: hypothetical protein LBC99_03085 [Spirochaetota bacterium]|jgi:chemotaxis protein methyltransferase CheR|nr:hypothetical protein [Spirochaetota bacterium]
MLNLISRNAEQYFGIRAEESEAARLSAHIRQNYGKMDAESIQRVFSSGEAAEFLMVHETYFFREPAHFALLLNLLPQFEKSGLIICSAAAANGCEAYSIAMLIESWNKGREKPLAYHIDALDISARMIGNARRGVYGTNAVREDGSDFHAMMAAYTEPFENGFRVREPLKKHIHFFTHNLMNPLPKIYDLIFFRNAFIYFTQQGRERVLSNISAALRAEGLLFLGVSETMRARHADMAQKTMGDTVYFQKIKSNGKVQYG